MGEDARPLTVEEAKERLRAAGERVHLLPQGIRDMRAPGGGGVPPWGIALGAVAVGVALGSPVVRGLVAGAAAAYFASKTKRARGPLRWLPSGVSYLRRR